MKDRTMAFSAPVSRNTNSTIYSIQVLRAVAALLVVADHTLIHIFTVYDLPQIYHVMAWKLGGIGVTTFFVISGFVMALTNDANFGRREEPLRFILNRIIRIMPLYWLMSAIAAALFIVTASKQISISYLLMSLFFIVPLDTANHTIMQPVLGPGWTLSYEMFFYAVFALFLMLPKRAALTGFTTVMVALVIWGMSTLSSTEINDPTSRFAFYANPLLLLFVGGVLLGALYKKYESVFQNTNINISWMYGAVALTLFISIATDKNSWPLILQPLVFILPLICVAIALLCRFQPVTRSGRLGVLLGEASYSIYLSHILVLAIMRKIVPVAPLFGIVYFIVVFTAAAVTGTGIYKFIEVPLTKYARKFIKLKRRQTTVTV